MIQPAVCESNKTFKLTWVYCVDLSNQVKHMMEHTKYVIL